MVLKNCRICKRKKLDNIISLGNQKITSIFKKYGHNTDILPYPIDLCICNDCGLVQLCETTPQDDMYKKNNYGYLSGISNTMKNHLKKYNDADKEILDLGNQLLEFEQKNIEELKKYL